MRRAIFSASAQALFSRLCACSGLASPGHGNGRLYFCMCSRAPLGFSKTLPAAAPGAWRRGVSTRTGYSHAYSCSCELQHARMLNTDQEKNPGRGGVSSNGPGRHLSNPPQRIASRSRWLVGFVAADSRWQSAGLGRFQTHPHTTEKIPDLGFACFRTDSQTERSNVRARLFLR